MPFLVLKNCALGIFCPPSRYLDLFLEATFAFRDGCQMGGLNSQILMNCMAESIYQLMQFFAEYGSGSHAGAESSNQLADVNCRHRLRFISMQNRGALIGCAEEDSARCVRKH
jgi:hypothetical protein